MRSDPCAPTTFFQLFQDFQALFFQLAGDPMDPSIVYEVKSVEVKEISFRLDGVFLPPDDHPHLPICFVEVQFQKDPLPSLPNTPYLAGSVTELAGNG